MFRVLVVGLAVLGAAGAARAQPAPGSFAARSAEMGEPRAVTVNGLEPFAVVRATQAFRLWDRAWGFYAVRSPRAEGGRPLFVARQVGYRRGGSTMVRWADSVSCPALLRLLTALEALEVPRPDVPQLGREGRGLPLDGVTYSFWSRFPDYGGASGYDLAFSANMGTPLAQWTDTAAEVLGDCWRDQPPAGVRPGQRR